MNTEDEKNDHSSAYFEKLFIDAVRRYSDDEEDHSEVGITIFPTMRF